MLMELKPFITLFINSNHMSRLFRLLPALTLSIVVIACSPSDDKNSTQKEITKKTANYWHDTSTYSPEGLVHALIEIPAGSDKKYELNKNTGIIEWETLDNGEKRRINHLPYPANYGMIPQTYLSPDAGGDGDPLDIILLGPAIKRGSIVPCRLIGGLQLTDNGEQDDKLIAIPAEGTFSELENLPQLDILYPGVTEIIRIWFSNYKGEGKLQSEGFFSKAEALKILSLSSDMYKNTFQPKTENK